MHGPQSVLAYVSKNGEEGFPGNLEVMAMYTLTEDNELNLENRDAGTGTTRPIALEAVATSGDYAYLADGPGGLRIVNVRNPSQPVEVAAAFSQDYVFGVSLAGHRAYLASAGSGLLVVDISSPSRPKELARLSLPAYAYGVAVVGQTAYVAAGWAGLAVIDVSNTN